MAPLTVLFGHSWEAGFPDRFAAHLNYLVKNDYRVLEGDELLHYLKTGESFPSRAVLITLDDGVLQDEAACDLLAGYDLPALIFAIPEPDVPAEYYHVEGNWDLWRRLAKSGRITIASHSLTHSKVFVSGKIEKFVLGSPERQNNQEFDYRPGAPIYKTAPGLVTRKYIPERDFHDSCVARLSELVGGGMSPEAAVRELRSFAEATPRRPDCFEAQAVFRQRIGEEIRQSKKIIEKRLGREVQFFCYPCGAETSEVAGLVEEAGYAASFTTKPARFSIGDDPFHIGRFDVCRYEPEDVFPAGP